MYIGCLRWWCYTAKSAQTKHGEPMEFATFEDLTGLYDATFFPETYRRFGHLLSGGKPYMMEGLVEEEFRTLTLTVTKVWVPSPPVSQLNNPFSDKESTYDTTSTGVIP